MNGDGRGPIVGSNNPNEGITSSGQIPWRYMKEKKLREWLDNVWGNVLRYIYICHFM